MFVMMILGCYVSHKRNVLERKKVDIVYEYLKNIKSHHNFVLFCRELAKIFVEKVNKSLKTDAIIKQKFAEQFIIKLMKMKFINRRSNNKHISPVQIKVCYHGTAQSNHKSIIESNLMVPDGYKLRHARNAGYYGRGIYMSPDERVARCYSTNSQVFVCLSLPGRQYKAKEYRINDNDYGIPLQHGYDSHISPNGKEWVFFNPSQLLPCCLVDSIRASSVKNKLLTYDVSLVQCTMITDVIHKLRRFN